MIVVFTFSDEETFTCEVELTETEDNKLILQTPEIEGFSNVVARQLQKQMKFYDTGAGGYKFSLTAQDNEYHGCFISSANINDRYFVADLIIRFDK